MDISYQMLCKWEKFSLQICVHLSELFLDIPYDQELLILCIILDRAQLLKHACFQPSPFILFLQFQDPYLGQFNTCNKWVLLQVSLTDVLVSLSHSLRCHHH